jgi:hypothetical protein
VWSLASMRGVEESHGGWWKGEQYCGHLRRELQAYSWDDAIQRANRIVGILRRRPQRLGRQLQSTAGHVRSAPRLCRFMLALVLHVDHYALFRIITLS